MEQRDYLMRQIEQLGQVLAKALAGLLNLKQVPDASLSIDEIIALPDVQERRR